MNEQNQEKNNQEEVKQERSLRKDDKEVQENKRPPEGAEPISNAGKKRDNEKRYQ